MQLRNLILVAACPLALVFSNNLIAKKSENVKEFDNYVVHYNALPTDFLSTKVAKQHKITRSRNRILLNITIKEKSTNNQTKSVQAKVTVMAINRTGQIKQTEMRPVHDGKAVYYIGEFNVANRELLKFKVKLTPISQKTTYTLNFRKQFFTR